MALAPPLRFAHADKEGIWTKDTAFLLRFLVVQVVDSTV
jgi:hypothetical protein